MKHEAVLIFISLILIKCYQVNNFIGHNSHKYMKKCHNFTNTVLTMPWLTLSSMNPFVKRKSNNTSRLVLGAKVGKICKICTSSKFTYGQKDRRADRQTERHMLGNTVQFTTKSKKNNATFGMFLKVSNYVRIYF